MGFFESFHKVTKMAVHDSSALLAVVCPHVFTKSRRTTVHVECTGQLTRGVSVADLRSAVLGKPPADDDRVTIMLAVDAADAASIYRERIASYQKFRIPHSVPASAVAQ